jgi:hypothetical protein
MKAVFRRAAERMDTIEECGCCRAITLTTTTTALTTYGEWRAHSVFSRMFRPIVDLGYWFPRQSPAPQHRLNARRAASTRQHRVFALLLAGEAWRSFR